MTPEQLKKRARQTAVDIAEAMHRLHDRITGQETRPRTWEDEQRERAKADMETAKRIDHAEGVSAAITLDLGTERAEREGIARAERDLAASRGEEREERTRSAFEVRNPEITTLINTIARANALMVKINTITNDPTMDVPAMTRAINTLITEQRRQELGIVDRGDVYGITRHERAVAQREGIARAERDIAKPKPARNRGRDDDLDLSL